MNILITGVGGPTPRNFARSLKLHNEYKNSKLIATDIHNLAFGLYQNNLFDETIISPKSSDPSYWKFMNELIRNKKIDLAIIMPETEVLEWSKYNVNNELPCKSLIPNFEMAKLCIDKGLMSNALEYLNLVPKSISFHRSDFSFQFLTTQLGGQFWIRSSKGTSGLGSLLINNENDLKSWIDINPKVENFLASEYLPGRNYACKMLYYKGNLKRVACGERVNYIMSKVSPSGITGNTSFGRLLNRPDLVEKAIIAMDSLFNSTNTEKHGFFTVDFKEDKNGNPLITEINIRHVAFTNCFALAGANFAAETVSFLISDEKISDAFKAFEFEEDTIFLRDVDENAIIMKESELL